MTRYGDGTGEPITIRLAGPGDVEAMRRLAEQHGEPVAAISLGTRSVVADPFRRTPDDARLLMLRRYQLLRQGGDVGPARSLLRRLLPGVAG
jgi:hypothetical protein